MSKKISYGLDYIELDKISFKEHDKLGRAKYAEQLTHIVKNTKKPFVMTLSAPWGSGKTFFLNAWKNEIAWDGEENADKIPCVYFSAWEYDCVDDPLLAIVGKIQEELNKVLAVEKTNLTAAEQEVENKRNKERKNMLIKLGKVARAVATKENLSKWGLKLLNKTVMKTVGENLDDFVEQGGFGEDFTKEDLQEFLKDVKNAIGTSPEKKLQAVLKEKESFIATVKEVVAECQEKLGKNYPILIMIDELDRCRPDYVISLLERIKNLFEVKGIFFVLAIDKEQLYSVVEHTFGVKKTEERDNRAVYLQKFVNMDFELPHANFVDYLDNFLFQYSIFKELVDEDCLVNFQGYDNPTVLIFLLSLGIAKIYSLRELERKFEKFNIILNSYKLDYLEALIVWFSILDSAPIKYLLFCGYADIGTEDGKFDMEKSYYEKQVNFIDNFITNLNLWLKGNATILEHLDSSDLKTNKWSMETYSGFCAQILQQYIKRYNLKAMSQENKMEFLSNTETKFESMLCFSSGFISE